MSERLQTIYLSVGQVRSMGRELDLCPPLCNTLDRRRCYLRLALALGLIRPPLEIRVTIVSDVTRSHGLHLRLIGSPDIATLDGTKA